MIGIQRPGCIILFMEYKTVVMGMSLQVRMEEAWSSRVVKVPT